jgi:CRISPR-associated protein Cas2
VQRNRYLVGYDIRHPKRLRLVWQAMKGYGEPLQYSLFVCDLTRAEKSAMQLHVGSLMDHSLDSVVLVDLGPASGGALRFDFMGIHRPLPDGGPTVL